MGLFSSTRQPHTRCALRCTAAGRQRGGSGGDGSGLEGREGEGRVPDCLGGLSRVGISSRSTRPWNGQPPSTTTIAALSSQICPQNLSKIYPGGPNSTAIIAYIFLCLHLANPLPLCDPFCVCPLFFTTKNHQKNKNAVKAYRSA